VVKLADTLKETRLSTVLFSTILIASMIAYILTPKHLKIFSFFFVIAQLFYIQYGFRKFIIKFFLLTLQVIMLF